MKAATEKLVRMAEQVTSSSPDDVLVTIGLGSCIGLALVDASMGVAGLSHVVMPESGSPRGAEPVAAKFADTAVPALIEELASLGATARRLEAVLVGGARMFALSERAGSSLDVGARNEAAVSHALDGARIPIRARATGGSKGRTIRVHVATGRVTVKEAGGEELELWTARSAVGVQ